MSNLPEKQVYITQLKAAGFTDIQVCQLFYQRYSTDSTNETFLSSTTFYHTFASLHFRSVKSTV